MWALCRPAGGASALCRERIGVLRRPRLTGCSARRAGATRHAEGRRWCAARPVARRTAVARRRSRATAALCAPDDPGAGAGRTGAGGAGGYQYEPQVETLTLALDRGAARCRAHGEAAEAAPRALTPRAGPGGWTLRWSRHRQLYRGRRARRRQRRCRVHPRGDQPGLRRPLQPRSVPRLSGSDRSVQAASSSRSEPARATAGRGFEREGEALPAGQVQALATAARERRWRPGSRSTRPAGAAASPRLEVSEYRSWAEVAQWADGLYRVPDDCRPSCARRSRSCTPAAGTAGSACGAR